MTAVTAAPTVTAVTTAPRPTPRRGRAARLALVGVVLVLGIVIGLAHEPDVGTPVSVHRSGIAGAVVGADHAKPVPAVRSVRDLLAQWRVLVPSLVALVLIVGPAWGWPFRREQDADRDRHPPVPRSLARARRGPPALA
jgi:hypothetical protein